MRLTLSLLPGLLMLGLVALGGGGPCRAADVPLTPYTIDSVFDGPGSVYAADVDGDGSLDVLGAATQANEIAWWHNGGGSPIAWTKQSIATSFGAAISVYAADIDGDSHTDVVGAGWSRNQIAWWRNEGGSPISWTKQVIANGFTYAHEVYACDLDRDDDVDVLGVGAGNNTLAWWRNDGGNPIVWTQQTLTTTFAGARSVRAADLDGDGDLDIVATALTANELSWWRNDGGNPIVWTKFVISNSFAGAHMVRPCDLDRDGDIDLAAAGYTADEVAWWRNDGGDPVVWTKFTIATGFDGAVTVCPADIDKDGDLDILGAAQDGSEIAWWSNEGGSPIVWNKHMIDPGFGGVWPAYAADLDGDTFIDIVAGGNSADEIRWWRNGLGLAGIGQSDGGNPAATPGGPVRLYQNSPNPFSPVTAIRFELARPDYVQLTIYDVAGRLVRSLVDGTSEAGSHSVAWDGSDDQGRQLPSGLYFYRMATREAVQTKPMALVR
ncbi:MAG TPA: FG-GAP-like repeat-containing protein [bacterium]|nr:FG-GAP-like repeat-containing protein [bacterium]